MDLWRLWTHVSMAGSVLSFEPRHMYYIIKFWGVLVITITVIEEFVLEPEMSIGQ
jgi:hypothetical protein